MWYVSLVGLYLANLVKKLFPLLIDWLIDWLVGFHRKKMRRRNERRSTPSLLQPPPHSHGTTTSMLPWGMILTTSQADYKLDISPHWFDKVLASVVKEINIWFMEDCPLYCLLYSEGPMSESCMYTVCVTDILAYMYIEKVFDSTCMTWLESCTCICHLSISSSPRIGRPMDLKVDRKHFKASVWMVRDDLCTCLVLFCAIN